MKQEVLLDRLDTSDHYKHRLARLRQPLYSDTEVAVIAGGWCIILTFFIFGTPLC